MTIRLVNGLEAFTEEKQHLVTPIANAPAQPE